MAENSADEARHRDEEFRAYVRDAAGTPSGGDQLSTLTSMRTDGVITDTEFERMKAKISAA